MIVYNQIRAVNRTVQVAAAIGIGLLLAGPAHAAGSGMPWEGPLDQILQSIEGPVARIVAVIIITLTGLTLAFGETSGGMRKLIHRLRTFDCLCRNLFLPDLLQLRRWSACLMVTTGLPTANKTVPMACFEGGTQ